MLSIISQQGPANQNHREITHHTHYPVGKQTLKTYVQWGWVKVKEGTEGINGDGKNK